MGIDLHAGKMYVCILNQKWKTVLYVAYDTIINHKQCKRFPRSLLRGGFNIHVNL